MTGVALLLMALGWTLAYSGVKGFNPASVISSVFTGQPPQLLAGVDQSATVPASGITSGVATSGKTVTASMQIILNAIKAEFGVDASGSVYNCRRYFNSSNPAVGFSEHAWGNAVDISTGTINGNQLARWAMTKRKAGLPIAQILWQGRDMISGSSVSDHYDHVHITAAPQMNSSGNAIPPCASGRTHKKPGGPK